MNQEQQAKLKEEMYQEQTKMEARSQEKYNAKYSGALAGCDTMACRPSIEEAADNAYRSSRRSQDEGNRLSELSDLLNKNPEIKRILTLLNLINY